jgi:histone deacetylase 1/2
MDDDDDHEEDERDPNVRRHRAFSSFLSPFSLSNIRTDSPPHVLAEAEVDRRIQRDDEFSDSEDEGEGDRRNRTSHRNSKSPFISLASPAATSSSAKTTNAPIKTDVNPLPPIASCGVEELLPPNGTNGTSFADGGAAGAEGAAEVEIAEVEMPVQGTSAARMTTTAGPGEDDGKGEEDVEMKTDDATSSAPAPSTNGTA